MGSALMASQQVQATSQARLDKSDSAAGATCSGLTREAGRQQHGGRDKRAAGWPQASRSWHPTVCCGDWECFQPFLTQRRVCPRAAHAHPVDVNAHMGASRLCRESGVVSRIRRR